MRALVIAVFLMLAFAVACDDEPGQNTMDAGTTTDSGMQIVCDPNDGSEQVQRLNAPVGQGVEVVQKTPLHPGEPGPDGLP